jgi:hypothetical protein
MAYHEATGHRLIAGNHGRRRVMLSRLYLIFVGILLIVLALGGYTSPGVLNAIGPSTVTPTLWLLSGAVALIVGLVVRSETTNRWVAGALGVVYLLWGMVVLFSLPLSPIFALSNLITFMSVGIGALGLAVAVLPMVRTAHPTTSTAAAM